MRGRPSNHTAALIAKMLKDHELTRARFSHVSLKAIAQTSRRLSSLYVAQVRAHLEADYNIIMCELDRGGYGLLAVRVLEGAKTLTPTMQDWNRNVSDKLLDELAMWSGQKLEDEEE